MKTIANSPYVIFNGKLYWRKSEVLSLVQCSSFFSYACQGRHASPSSPAFTRTVELSHTFIEVDSAVNQNTLRGFSPKYPYATDGKVFIYQNEIIKDIDLPKDIKNTSLKIVLTKSTKSEPDAYHKSALYTYGKNVLYQDKKMMDVDGESFKFVEKSFSYNFFKDKNRVYSWRYYMKKDGEMIAELVPIEQSDPQTFKVVNEHLLNDKNHVWRYNEKNNVEPFYTAVMLPQKFKPNLTSLTVCDETTYWSCPYGQNSTQVTFSDKIIQGADIVTFERIDTPCYDTYVYNKRVCIKPFSKDKNAVYWKDQKIEKADPKTFRIVSAHRLEDKNHVWSYDLNYAYSKNPPKLEKDRL